MNKKLIIAAAVLALVVVANGVAVIRHQKQAETTTEKETTTTEQAIVKVDGANLGINKLGQITPSPTDTLPTIFLPPELEAQEGQTISSKEVLFALSLVEALTKSDFTPKQVRFVDNIDVIVYSQSEASARFTSAKDAAEQVDSLQSVLSKAKIDASKISQIDLRFDKPVVTNKK